MIICSFTHVLGRFKVTWNVQFSAGRSRRSSMNLTELPGVGEDSRVAGT